MPALFTSTSILPCSATPGGDGPLDVVLDGDVARDRGDLGALGPAGLADGFEQLGAAGRQHEVGPGVRQDVGEVLAQPVRTRP